MSLGDYPIMKFVSHDIETLKVSTFSSTLLLEYSDFLAFLFILSATGRLLKMSKSHPVGH